MYVAIRRVKANKLFNKKLYSWPKYAVFVYKDIITQFQCEQQTIHSSSIEKKQNKKRFPNWKHFLKMEMDCIVKLVFIGEKPGLRILCMCDCQSLWVIDDFGGMPAEP